MCFLYNLSFFITYISHNIRFLEQNPIHITIPIKRRCRGPQTKTPDGSLSLRLPHTNPKRSQPHENHKWWWSSLSSSLSAPSAAARPSCIQGTRVVCLHAWALKAQRPALLFVAGGDTVCSWEITLSTRRPGCWDGCLASLSLLYRVLSFSFRLFVCLSASLSLFRSFTLSIFVSHFNLIIKRKKIKLCVVVLVKVTLCIAFQSRNN